LRRCATLPVMQITPDHEEEVLTAGDLRVRPGDGLVVAAGRTLPLSQHEVRLLVALMRRADRIVSRQELYQMAWGGSLRKGDRTVDVYIRRLRSKLDGALPGWAHIHTHFGFGYRFSPERSQAFHDGTTGA
jgi:DNA-binding response OmpR family regulator